MNKRLKEMEEEYQILMFESDGVHTEEIKELGERIDGEKECIESEKFRKAILVDKDSTLGKMWKDEEDFK